MWTWAKTTNTDKGIREAQRASEWKNGRKSERARKNYYDILLVTENIKVATNGRGKRAQKKGSGNEQLYETGFCFVNSICSMIRGFLFGFQLILSVDQVFARHFHLCIVRFLVHSLARLVVRSFDELPLCFYIHSDINKMSAPERTGNNGEIEHCLYVHESVCVPLRCVDSKLMVLFADIPLDSVHTQTLFLCTSCYILLHSISFFPFL